ncbi:hypothetical protein GJ496_000960 [Pomphorhynchus laevis]|nr:hypothetical protein GJ496_000960 [Pomphorhynchus laevis]
MQRDKNDDQIGIHRQYFEKCCSVLLFVKVLDQVKLQFYCLFHHFSVMLGMSIIDVIVMLNVFSVGILLNYSNSNSVVLMYPLFRTLQTIFIREYWTISFCTIFWSMLLILYNLESKLQQQLPIGYLIMKGIFMSWLMVIGDCYALSKRYSQKTM